MYYFVVNPVSGCGKGKKIWNTIKKERKREGRSADFCCGTAFLW